MRSTSSYGTFVPENVSACPGVPSVPPLRISVRVTCSF